MKHLTLVRGLPGSGKTSFVWRCMGDMLESAIQMATDDYFMVSKLRSPATCDCYERHMDDDYGEGQFSPQSCCYEEVYDYIRMMEEDSKVLGKNHAKCLAAAKTAMEDDKYQSIWVHNTFSCRWEMEPYMDLAKSHGFQVTIIDIFDGGLSNEELHARGTHKVPLKVIEDMRGRWESEWRLHDTRPPWERTTAVQDFGIANVAATIVSGTDPIHEAEEAEKIDFADRKREELINSKQEDKS
jgi:predicted kinase